MKCIRKERLEDHTRGEKQDLGHNPSGEVKGVRERCFEGEKINFCQERNEKVNLISH